MRSAVLSSGANPLYSGPIRDQAQLAITMSPSERMGDQFCTKRCCCGVKAMAGGEGFFLSSSFFGSMPRMPRSLSMPCSTRPFSYPTTGAGDSWKSRTVPSCSFAPDASADGTGAALPVDGDGAGGVAWRAVRAGTVLLWLAWLCHRSMLRRLTPVNSATSLALMPSRSFCTASCLTCGAIFIPIS